MRRASISSGREGPGERIEGIVIQKSRDPLIECCITIVDIHPVCKYSPTQTQTQPSTL